MAHHAVEAKAYLADLRAYPEENWLGCVAVDLRAIALSIASANRLLDEEGNEPEIRELLHDMIDSAAEHLMQYAMALVDYERMKRKIPSARTKDSA